MMSAHVNCLMSYKTTSIIMFIILVDKASELWKIIPIYMMFMEFNSCLFKFHIYIYI